MAHHSYRHGGCKTRVYHIWLNMRARCFCPTDTAFRHYGGRGIAICPEWDDFVVFRDWALANGYADNLTIDRRDNDQGYSPGNCQWITHAAQQANRRNVRRDYPSRQRAEALGVRADTYHWRVRNGWPVEIAETATTGSRLDDLLAAPACPAGLQRLPHTRRSRLRQPKERGAGTFAGWNGRRRGEGNPRARLTEEAVRELRARHAAGERLCDLSRAANLNRATVRHAITGRTWSHVQ